MADSPAAAPLRLNECDADNLIAVFQLACEWAALHPDANPKERAILRNELRSRLLAAPPLASGGPAAEDACLIMSEGFIAAVAEEAGVSNSLLTTLCISHEALRRTLRSERAENDRLAKQRDDAVKIAEDLIAGIRSVRDQFLRPRSSGGPL